MINLDDISDSSSLMHYVPFVSYNHSFTFALAPLFFIITHSFFWPSTTATLELDISL